MTSRMIDFNLNRQFDFPNSILKGKTNQIKETNKETNKEKQIKLKKQI